MVRMRTPGPYVSELAETSPATTRVNGMSCKIRMEKQWHRWSTNEAQPAKPSTSAFKSQLLGKCWWPCQDMSRWWFPLKYPRIWTSLCQPQRFMATERYGFLPCPSNLRAQLLRKIQLIQIQVEPEGALFSCDWFFCWMRFGKENSEKSRKALATVVPMRIIPRNQPG